MPKAAADADAKAYNAVINRTTLRGIWMMDSRFDMKPQALDGGGPTLRHSVETNVEEVIAGGDGTLHGFLRFIAYSRHGRQRVISVSARYFVSYHVDGGCTQDMANLFISRVGRLAAYPYFRALVSSLVSQAGAQVPPLPIMSFQPRSIDYARDAPRAQISADE
jgi:preprotein translocase subunit SecB